MTRFKITIAYDGTAYSGWQVQPHNVSVQQTIQDAIHTITSETVKLHGSGRTDQGVHARAQVAHFDLTSKSGKDRKYLLKSLNAILPLDIRLTAIATASDDFHARRSAVSKEYRYFIWNGPILPPFLRNYRAHISKPLDVAAMNKAARYLVGTHDFSSFTANPNREIESTIRTMTRLSLTRRGPEIMIRAAGDGFLYKMVRSLAGFLIRVGWGAEAPESAVSILAAKVRTARVPTAQPQGLFLWKIDY